jgi:hypothetical protein
VPSCRQPLNHTSPNVSPARTALRRTAGAADVVGVDVGHHEQLEEPVFLRERLHLLQQEVGGRLRAAVDEHTVGGTRVAVLDPQRVAVPRRHHLDGEELARPRRGLARRAALERPGSGDRAGAGRTGGAGRRRAVGRRGGRCRLPAPQHVHQAPGGREEAVLAVPPGALRASRGEPVGERGLAPPVEVALELARRRRHWEGVAVGVDVEDLRRVPEGVLLATPGHLLRDASRPEAQQPELRQASVRPRPLLHVGVVAVEVRGQAGDLPRAPRGARRASGPGSRRGRPPARPPSAVSPRAAAGAPRS